MWITYVVLLSLAVFLMFYLLWQADRKEKLQCQNHYLQGRLTFSERPTEPLDLQRHIAPFTTRLDQFWTELSKWSQATFGPDSWRGPTGSLKHLAKEVQETLQDPVDLMEYADMQFLVFDACRRAGFNYYQLESAVWRKLDINKKRSWPPPSQEGISEHHREVA